MRAARRLRRRARAGRKRSRALLRAPASVSYTHLDVYKRQGYNGTYNGVLLGAGGAGLGELITALQAADRAQKLEQAV